jgi:hypothetical protein
MSDLFAFHGTTLSLAVRDHLLPAVYTVDTHQNVFLSCSSYFSLSCLWEKGTWSLGPGSKILAEYPPLCIRQSNIRTIYCRFCCIFYRVSVTFCVHYVVVVRVDGLNIAVDLGSITYA